MPPRDHRQSYGRNRRPATGAGRVCHHKKTFPEAARTIFDHCCELAAIALLRSRQLDLLNEKTESLRRALSEVRALRALLPICAWCRKVRDDEGLWTQLEAYLADHTETRFTHGLYPDCAQAVHLESEPAAAPSGQAWRRTVADGAGTAGRTCGSSRQRP